MFLFCFYAVNRICNSAFGDGISENSLLFLSVVDTCGGFDIEVFNGADVEVNIAKSTPISITVVGVAFKTCERVFAVGIATNRTCKFAVCGVNRQRGIELQHVFNKSARSLNLVGAVYGEIFANFYNASTVGFYNVVISIQTSRKTLKIRMFDNTVVFVISQREERRTALRTVADREIVLLNNACACCDVEPIGIGGGSSAGGVKIFVHCDAIEHGNTVVVVTPIVFVAETVLVGIETVVYVALPHHLSKLFGIQNVEFVGVVLHSDTCVKIYLYLAFLAAFGGDDDNAVGSAATVDRGRSGIFQDLDRFDVVAVEFVHTRFSWHAVDDVERVVVVESADTTDSYRSRTRRRTIGRNIHTRHTSLHCFERVVLVLLGNVVGLHYRNRPCQIRLFLYRIARYHNLVEFAHLFFEGDAEILGGGYFGVLKADVRDNECLALFNGEFEIAVEVGDCAVGSALYYYGGADYRIPRLVGNITCNFCLRVQCRTCKHEQ